MGKSIKKQFSQTHAGLSPYCVWILVGIILGTKIPEIKDEYKKKQVSISLRGDTHVFPVMTNAVKSLEKYGFIQLNTRLECYKLTSKGFNVAHDKLKEAGFKLGLSSTI
jgi:hypothetical protein